MTGFTPSRATILPAWQTARSLAIAACGALYQKVAQSWRKTRSSHPEHGPGDIPYTPAGRPVVDVTRPNATRSESFNCDHLHEDDRDNHR